MRIKMISRSQPGLHCTVSGLLSAVCRYDARYIQHDACLVTTLPILTLEPGGPRTINREIMVS